jgi:RNA polymerase sigma-70 factor (ECF subfamily)
VRIIREAQYIRALQSRDETALEEIIRQYTGYVSTIVWNIIGNTMTNVDAEEVVSDVFLSLWNNADKVRPGKLKPYLGSIARSRAKNKLREKHNELYIEDDELAIAPADMERQLTEKEEKAAVTKAVLSLAPQDRDISIRYYYLCQTAREIAEETDLNLFTVQSRLRHGRDRLKYNSIKRGCFFDDKDNESP